MGGESPNSAGAAVMEKTPDPSIAVDGTFSASETRKAMEAQAAAETGAKPGSDDDKTKSEVSPAPSSDSPKPGADGTKTDEEGKPAEESKETEPKKPEDQRPGDTVTVEEEYKAPTLDEELAKNPAIKERYDQMVEGFNKVVGQVKADHEEMQKLFPVAQRMASYTERIDKSADDAALALADAVQASAALHNVKPAQIWAGMQAALKDHVGDTSQRGSSPSAPAGTVASLITDENWQEHFDHKEDYDIYRKAVDHSAQAKFDSFFEALGIKPEELKAVVEGHRTNVKQAQRDKEWKAYVSQHLPGVQSHFKTNYNGYEVTEKMFEEAVEKFPALSKTPNDAVRAHFSDKIIAHQTAAVSKRTGKDDITPGPERTDLGGGVEGIKDVDQINAASTRKALAAQNKG